MKTKLPTAISTVDEAKAFLTELVTNGEAFHCEDDARDIVWNLPAEQQPTLPQCDLLNKLMNDIYNLPGNDGKHDNSIDFCPCAFVLDEIMRQWIKGTQFFYEERTRMESFIVKGENMPADTKDEDGTSDNGDTLNAWLRGQPEVGDKWVSATETYTRIS